MAVRIGFVGVGGMGQCAHLRNYAINPECKVVALAELRPELGKRVGERYGIEKLYRSHREMLAEEKLDGVVAIQQYSAHGRILPEVFGAGVPVMIEKPLALSAAVGEKIVAVLGKSKAKLFVGYHKRSDPATIYARKQIEAWKTSGEMGAMKYVRITMPPGSWDVQGFSTLIKTSETYPEIERDPCPAGMDSETAKKLDTFVNYYIHQVNLMRHLMGENYSVSYADPAQVVMVVHGESGVSGTLEMQPYRTTVDWQEVAMVAFEKGWIKVELPAPLAMDRPGRVTVFEDKGGGATPVTMEPQLPWVHAMRQQANHFVRAIGGETTPLCEASEALEDLRVAHRYIEMLGDAQRASGRKR